MEAPVFKKECGRVTNVTPHPGQSQLPLRTETASVVREGGTASAALEDVAILGQHQLSWERVSGRGAVAPSRRTQPPTTISRRGLSQ